MEKQVNLALGDFERKHLTGMVLASLAKMAGNSIIPAKAGIQDVRNLSNLDSGSPLRSARNDEAFSLSKWHCI